MPRSFSLCDTALTNSDNDTWHPLSCRHFVPTAENRKHNAVVQLVTATVQESWWDDGDRDKTGVLAK